MLPARCHVINAFALVCLVPAPCFRVSFGPWFPPGGPQAKAMPVRSPSSGKRVVFFWVLMSTA